MQSEADRDAFTDRDTTVDGPARSDTMMVLHADGDDSYAVSFPRDLLVDVPGLGEQKINAAFNEGPQLVIDTLQQNFDLGVKHYLEVNFKTFEDLVNAVGSVPVYFPYQARDELSGLKQRLRSRAATTSTGPRRSPTSVPGTSSTRSTASGSTPARRPTSTASTASRTSSRSSGASR